jgi:hypothetical protein
VVIGKKTLVRTLAVFAHDITADAARQMVDARSARLSPSAYEGQ